eukprot:SAG11_NODE_19518_length_465_cov_0.696721_1_plen_116_part_10
MLTISIALCYAALFYQLVGPPITPVEESMVRVQSVEKSSSYPKQAVYGADRMPTGLAPSSAAQQPIVPGVKSNPNLHVACLTTPQAGALPSADADEFAHMGVNTVARKLAWAAATA